MVKINGATITLLKHIEKRDGKTEHRPGLVLCTESGFSELDCSSESEDRRVRLALPFLFSNVR